MQNQDILSLNNFPFPSDEIFLNKVALRPRVIEEFIKKLQFVDKQMIPMLFLKDRHG